MKKFVRIEPTTIQEVGDKFKSQAVIKRYQTGDGLRHEFTTFFPENATAAIIIAVTNDGKIILTHEFRSGPERWLYNFPSGGIRDGESTLEGARRELHEEVGCIPESIEYIGPNFGGPYINIEYAVFLASGCTLDEKHRELDKMESDQGFSVIAVSISELMRLIKEGQICNSGSLLMVMDRLNMLHPDLVKTINEEKNLNEEVKL